MGRFFSLVSDEFRRLLGGGAGGGVVSGWDDCSVGRACGWLALVVVGGACYGVSIGLWRAPAQAGWVAVKMPLLILLTLGVNGVFNGMLAAVLGTGLGFRQTVAAIGRSFAVFALVVGGVGPVAAFLTMSLPSGSEAGGERAYRVLLLAHTAAMALGGVYANVRLLGWLEARCGRWAARRVVVAWLAGNLFVGAQLSYTLRPFFGNPELPVQFLRPDPFEGNFYESIWHVGRRTLWPSARESTPPRSTHDT